MFMSLNGFCQQAIYGGMAPHTPIALRGVISGALLFDPYESAQLLHKLVFKLLAIKQLISS